MSRLGPWLVVIAFVAAVLAAGTECVLIAQHNITAHSLDGEDWGE